MTDTPVLCLKSHTHEVRTFPQGSTVSVCQCRWKCLKMWRRLLASLAFVFFLANKSVANMTDVLYPAKLKTYEWLTSLDVGRWGWKSLENQDVLERQLHSTPHFRILIHYEHTYVHKILRLRITERDLRHRPGLKDVQCIKSTYSTIHTS